MHRERSVELKRRVRAMDAVEAVSVQVLGQPVNTADGSNDQLSDERLLTMNYLFLLHI
jgi:hypothetical protein